MIPKIIHYCWFGKNPIPDRYKEWMKSWKKYCPDYEIVEWNESNYDVHKNAYMAEAYEAKKWGFVPDYARLDILYEHGGIYLDTDVEVVRSFDPLLNQQAFIGFEGDSYVNVGSGMGTISNNPTILDMRNDYDNRHFRREDGTIDVTASPVYQTNILKSMGLETTGLFQKLTGINVYPRSFFCPLSAYGKCAIKYKESFSIHHFDASWVDKKQKELWLSCKEIYYAFEYDE